MKPLNSKEVRELELAEKSADLRAANRESARRFLLDMLASLPRTPSRTETTIQDLRSRIRSTIDAGSGRR